MSNVSLIPVWKEGDTLTAADRLHEIALLAQVHPEKFERFVLVHVGTAENGNVTINHYQFGCDLPQQLGLFELGKQFAYEESHT